MTPIGPLSQIPDTAAPAAQASGASAASAKTAATAATKQSAVGGEAVTLSSDAQTTAQLLTAARNSDGIDQATVQSLKSQIQSGTYNVPPDKLATAIVTALNGIS
jgi:flagellar biosynthesis anti-sigma factor FlgM